MADDEVFRVRGRAVVAVLVAVALGLGVLAALLQASNLHGALTAFERADKAWFAGLLAGQLIAYGGYAWGYRTMARACGGPLFTFWTTLRLSIVSFGAYVIASSAGGLGVDFWALHHAGEGPHRAARRVLAFNILEWAVLGTLAAVAAAASLAVGGGGAPLAMALAWLVLVPSCVVAALWVSGRRHASELAKLPREEAPEEPGRLTRARAHWLRVEARTLFADAVGALVFLRMLLSHPLRYGDGVVAFAVYWLGDLLTLYTAVEALGGSIGPLALVLAYTTGYVVTSAPLPAGAAGFSEASTAATLHAVGLPLGTAIFAVLLYRAFTFWLPIAPAVAILPHVRGLAGTLIDAPRERDAPCSLELD